MSTIKKVTVHAGHNKNGKIACGASDWIDESKEARVITKKVVSMLKKSGIKAVDCTVNNGTSQSDVLEKICAKCNAQKDVDLNVSIHFNASQHATKDGRTTGVEVLVRNMTRGNIRYETANNICKNISKIGFKNRGVKQRTDLYFLNKTKAPAILIEVCFVTDQDDAALYKKHKDDIARAIVDGILSWK